MVVQYVSADILLHPDEPHLDMRDLSDRLVVGVELRLPEPVDFEETQYHHDEIGQQAIGCDEVLVDRDISLDIFLVLLDLALEQTFKQTLLACVELLLLEFEFLLLLPEFGHLLVVDRVLPIDI